MLLLTDILSDTQVFLCEWDMVQIHHGDTIVSFTSPCMFDKVISSSGTSKDFGTTTRRCMCGEHDCFAELTLSSDGNLTISDIDVLSANIGNYASRIYEALK